MSDLWDLGWNEYLIKCFAWARMEREKWRRTRLIAFESRIGSHLNPKTLPKSIEQYLPIDEKTKRKGRVTDEDRAEWRRQFDEYNRKVQAGEIEDIRKKLKLKGFEQ